MGRSAPHGERFEAVVAWLDGAVSARLSHAELEEQLQVDGRNCCGNSCKTAWACVPSENSGWST
jgi:prepilin-type processing-associated H-X9-DG protein